MEVGIINFEDFFVSVFGYPLIEAALYLAFGQKLLIDGYCDMSMYISRTTSEEMSLLLYDTDGSAKKLYKNSYPVKTNFSAYVEEVLTKEELENANISLVEAQAIVHWVFRAFKTESQRREAFPPFLLHYFTFLNVQLNHNDKLGSIYGKSIPIMNFLGKGNILLQDDIVYLSWLVEVVSVTSISKFYSLLKGFSLPENSSQLYYRGQSSASFLLEPSVMRKPSWLENEQKMYHEIIINSWENFKNVDSHLDFLVEMQHYELPTRLLDITGNPLVALYFACCSSPKSVGEVVVFQQDESDIRFPNSDTAAILSCLPLLSYEHQQQLKSDAKNYGDNTKKFCAQPSVNLLLQEIRSKNPAFQSQIDPSDILSCCMVRTIKKNARIIQQDGAFILCGLIQGEDVLNNLRYRDGDKTTIFVVPQEHKQGILEELDAYKINESTLFPEITKLAGYVKGKY